MASPYVTHGNTRQTPQSAPIPGREAEMAPNNAGGSAFVLDKWGGLDRFLLLGSEGGTYYASERKLTLNNLTNLRACVAEDGVRVVRAVVAVSTRGRAPKNDPAIWALVSCMKLGDEATRRAAADALPRVCRIGTHLFQAAEAVKALGGWGRTTRRAFAHWYAQGGEDPEAVRRLGYQLIKYQQRDGWSHRDVLRKSHPKLVGIRNDLVHWATHGWPDIGADPHPEPALQQVWAFERAKRAESEAEIVQLVRGYRLPRECVPSRWLNSPKVWEALLAEMPIGAMVRNLGKMTSIGLVAPLSNATQAVCAKLGDADALRASRLHPLALLVALNTYHRGQGVKGALAWSPVSQVCDALDAAFYGAFGNVETTGKRWLLAIDVSGSMACGEVAGMTGVTPRVGSAAMALVTAATEPRHHIVGFTHGISELDISPRMRLDAVTSRLSGLPFGGTDCALPMIYARENRLPVDVFSVYCVDEETQILTAAGWCAYDAIAAGDEVYTLNHATGEGEWQRATAINIFPPAPRDMILMEGRAHSSLTTPEHRWPVRHRGNAAWGRRWKTSETLNNVDYIQCAATDSGLPVKPTYTDAFVEIVAWAWTEGNWNGSSALSIVQSVRVNPLNCVRIREALMEHLGPPSHTSMYPARHDGVPLWVESAENTRGVICWRLNAEASRAFHDIMTVPEKVIRLSWFRALTLRQLELFIDVSMRADGHMAKQRLSQGLPARAEAFAFACLLAGRAVTYCAIDNEHHKGYLEIGLVQRTQFAPLQHATNADERAFLIERREYDGHVWCPTTPNGTWLARRRGSVYWTGNTDNETWAGAVHPVQALQQYRQAMGIPAKLIVVGMTSTGFTIADPADAGMMDVVGFDTAAPQVMAEFTHA